MLNSWRGKPTRAWREKEWSDLNRTNDLLPVVGVKVTQSVKWPVPELRFSCSVFGFLFSLNIVHKMKAFFVR